MTISSPKVVFAALAALAALAASGPALSAPVPVYDWAGFYAGFGGSIAGIDVSAGPGSLSPSGTSGSTFTGSGGLFDVFGGFNATQDSLLYGLEAEVSVGRIAGTNPSPTTPSLTVNAIGSLSGRLGMMVSGFTVYGKAGLAMAVGNATENHGSGDKGSSAVHVGGIVGVGTEYQVSDTMSVRGELSYAAFAPATYSFPEDALHTHDIGFTSSRATVSLVWAIK